MALRQFGLFATIGFCNLLAYSPAQSNAGRLLYASNCASCHLQDLSGRNEAPPGSPRDVPNIIAPEIHHPLNGNALYVFALDESK